MIEQIIRRARQKVRRKDDDSSTASILTKAKRDVRAAERAVSESERLEQAARGARRGGAAVKSAAEAVETDGQRPSGNENTEALRRAEDKARSGAPVEGVALSPAGSPARLEALGGGTQRSEPPGDDTMMGLVMGLEDDDATEPLLGLTPGNGGGEPPSVADNNDGTEPLEFESDLLGVGGDQP